MKSHPEHETQSSDVKHDNSNNADVTQFLDHQADSINQSIIIDEGLSIWEVRQMFHRVLAGWALDVLTLRKSGLHEVHWNHADKENDLNDGYSLAA